MASLRLAFADKAVEFANILKMGRTQLQEAVPMTLGQEFNTFTIMLGEDEARLAEAANPILEINLGGTAIGTGITTHPDYAAKVCAALARITGVPVIAAADLIEATQDCGALVQLSGLLKRVRALSDDYFETNPDEINWGHVGTLNHYTSLLRQITDSAFKEGEHAE